MYSILLYAVAMEKHTVQRILKQHLGGFLKSNKVPLHHLKALDQLSSCRTSALGAHAQYCEDGHLNGIWYNSCKHRSCPQCRGKATEEWLLNTQGVLLDCPHHHIIFTMPSELNTLWQYNRTYLSNVLFKATQETLKEFAKDPKYLGGSAGILCALHTWGRNLSLHPHIHVLMSHGGINGEGKWVEPKKSVLFPQKPVMMVYRGKLLAMIEEGLEKRKLVIPPAQRISDVMVLLKKLRGKSWVVHFCNRYDHGAGVAKYLSRYVKSGPLKNRQIKVVRSSEVSFSYRSHQTKRVERLALPINDFIRRLLEHVPQPGKPTVRYSGLYNSAARNKLNEARKVLGQSPVSERQMLGWQAYLENKNGLAVCAECGKPVNRMEVITENRRSA